MKLPGMHRTSRTGFSSGNRTWGGWDVQRDRTKWDNTILKVLKKRNVCTGPIDKRGFLFFTSAKVNRQFFYSYTGFITVWQLIHSIARGEALHNQFINYHDLSQKLEYKVPPAASVHERIHLYELYMNYSYGLVYLFFFEWKLINTKKRRRTKENVCFEKNKLNLW